MRSCFLCFVISLSFLGCGMLHPRVYTEGEIIKMKKGETVMLAEHTVTYCGMENTFYQFKFDKSPMKVTCRAKLFKSTLLSDPPVLAVFDIINVNSQEIYFKVINFKKPPCYKCGEKLKPMKF